MGVLPLIHIIGMIVLLTFASIVNGQQSQPAPMPAAEVPFDWSSHRTSVADLAVGLRLPFRHGKPDLTTAETDAYVELLNTIAERRFAAQTEPSGEARSSAAMENAWETAFYKFEHARRLSWSNGNLPLRSGRSSAADPGSPNTARGGNLSRAALAGEMQSEPWTLTGDMQNYPGDYVGRPVVLYGLYSPSGTVQLDAERANTFGDRSEVRLQRGFLRNLTDNRDFAIVDAVGYIGPNNQLKALQTWPADQGTAVPVLVKGWFVKLWGQQPLIVTEAVRILTPRPYDELVRAFAPSRTMLSTDERWLYYETLRQMQLTSGSAQSQLAGVVLRRRLETLISEIRDKTTAEKQLLEQQRRRETVTEDQYRDQKLKLDRQLAVRIGRYREYLETPDRFPLFVDVFQYPDRWQGAMVSFSGHIRRVVSYAGDAELFGGQMLHELWLYTDDSQHNPAVIITPSLPPDFPTEAEVVDRVSVTGCFFKMYVYRAESEHRIAPLILCGRISWNPTDDQILALSREGAIPPKSALVLAARRRAETNISDTAIMLFGFLGIVVMMAIWGRVQRDRRERQRLLVLVNSAVDAGPSDTAWPSGQFPDYAIDRFRE